jgi:aminopeptidase N
MHYLKILIIILLTLVIGSHNKTMANITNEVTVGISSELANKRAKLYSDISYQLNFELTAKAEIIPGKVKIQVTVLDPLEPLVLDFKGTSQEVNQINGKLQDKSITVNKKTVLDFQQINGHIIIPKEALEKGSNSIEIAFLTSIQKSGASITRYTDKEDSEEYIYSLFVPSDASMAFPCFDQPDLKARFSLSVTAPQNWQVVTNTGLTNSTLDNNSAIKSLHFQETKPISTYLFAFAAGPFEKLTIENSKFPMQMYVRKSKLAKAQSELQEISRISKEGFQALGEYFDYPYPFGKCDLVILPEFAYGGMEHVGAIFYREDRMLFPNQPSPNDLLNRASLILHEQAHQWFGNLVTMQWFDDLWLKEGFATFMAYRAMEKVYPQNVWKNFYQSNKPRAYLTDSTKGTTPIFQEIPNLKDAKSAYGNIVYTKAPSVLRQLEFYLGQETFQKGVQSFLKTHAFANARWSDLISAYEKAANCSLKTWAEAWVKQRSMPVIEPTLEIKDGLISSLKLTERNILGEETLWPIKTKLILFYQNQSPIVLTVNLTSTTTVVLDVVGKPKPDYIFSNYEDFGYGQFRLDKESLAFIKDNLAKVSDEFLRALLWGAIWDEVRESTFAPTDYLDLVSKAIANEHDPITVQQILANTSTAFSYYLSKKQQLEIQDKIETTIFSGLAKENDKGLRLTYFRALPYLISSQTGRTKLKQLLSGEWQIPEIELKAKDRWEILTSLIAQDDLEANNLINKELQIDKSSDSERYHFIALAAQANKDLKKSYFSRYLEDSQLAENWIELSLRAFNSANQADLTLPYLKNALEALPKLKQTRKIFFINEWLSAFIGGQESKQALDVIDGYLQNNNIDKDLKLKILEATDRLERCVKIRTKFAAEK